MGAAPPAAAPAPAGSGDPVEDLVVDLLAWVGPGPRPYDEVLDAWRTSCPRLPVWEEANARGYVACRLDDRLGRVVVVTPAGRRHLGARRPVAPA